MKFSIDSFSLEFGKKYRLTFSGLTLFTSQLVVLRINDYPQKLLNYQKIKSAVLF